MDTPICRFVQDYAASDTVRMHMPGHKGMPLLGPEASDITEIYGADSLYEAEGIIARSEASTAALFGSAKTFYSTEGSSQCIRAMLALAAFFSGSHTSRTVVAARNVHRSFLTAAALLDLSVCWLTAPEGEQTLCSCPITPQQVEEAISTLPAPPCAVFLTSPDYLGGMADIRGIADAAHRHGVPLLVDNAHGAYLHFLPVTQHPLDLGADACCDSAHKTLPALTGCAYLHLSVHAPAAWADNARRAMAMFGSSSPSYLLLQSMDRLTALLSGEWPRQLESCVRELAAIRSSLSSRGWEFFGSEPMKITLCAARRGYRGGELAHLLRQEGIECEYADPDYLVLMPSPANRLEELVHMEKVLSSLPARTPLSSPRISLAPEKILSIREAMLSPAETVSSADAVGRILAESTLACPPAVPLLVSGERIPKEAIPLFEHYGIERLSVISE